MSTEGGHRPSHALESLLQKDHQFLGMKVGKWALLGGP